jgi:hypothetical protein
MDKKKAVKLATASALAASAFVAANPNASQAATNVDAVVSQAKAQFKKAFDTYAQPVNTTGKFADIKVVYAEYNKAKKAYTDAKALVQKAGGAKKEALLADLDATYNEYIKKRVATYIDAYNYALKLDGLRQQLASAVQAKDLAKAEALYHQISYELKSRTVILDRVYGKSTRDLLRSTFKAEAQKLRDSLVYDITVAMKVREVQDAVKAGNLDKAKAAVDQINLYLPKVTDAFKAQLTDAAKQAIDAYEAALTPKVESVSAINAKELVIKFNKAIDKSTVIEASGANAGTLVDGAITVSSLDGHPVTINDALATLSTDGKTLTLQAKAAEVFDGRYDVNITKGAIKTTDGKDVEGYKDTIKAEDTVAPSILGTTRVTSTQVKINFSEPINETVAGTLPNKVSFKYADGTSVNGTITYTLSSDNKSLTVDLSDNNITAGKDIVATFVGVKDFAGNIITPNPATVTIQKGQKDGVAPTVVDLKAINNKTIEIKFSEELASAPSVTVTNGTVASVTQDTTDKTKYIVTTTGAVSGLQTVTVAAGYTDLSGEQGTAYSKVVNFDVDTAAPNLVSATVKKGTDNAEYLELTFDEEVSKNSALANISVSGTKYKDYVTSSFTATVPANKLVVDTNNKKVARIKLADLLSGDDVEGAVYDLTLTGKDASATPANVAIVEDVSGNDGATSVKATFTRGKDGVAPSNAKATIDTSVDTNGIAVVDNNTLTVAFNQEVDGATATDVNNYKIDGAVVEKAILNPVNPVTGKQTVTLKLKAGSNLFTGERNIVISGVKAKNGLVMDVYKTTENLKENVAPTITKAQLTDTNKITLTFSEPVKNAAQDTNDFELYIGGVKVASNDTITTAQQTTAGTTLVLTLEQPVTAADLAKGLTIKALDTIDITDVAGNTASVPVNVTVAQ